MYQLSKLIFLFVARIFLSYPFEAFFNCRVIWIGIIPHSWDSIDPLSIRVFVLPRVSLPLHLIVQLFRFVYDMI